MPCGLVTRSLWVRTSGVGSDPAPGADAKGPGATTVSLIIVEGCVRR